jgi:DNA-binding CsgD family transcriptional regulator
VSEAFKAGAQGIVLKESTANSLYKCISAVMEGQYWIPDEGILDALRFLEEAPQSSKIKPLLAKFCLTKKGTQILAVIVAGKTNLLIAKKFSISEQTVKHHATNYVRQSWSVESPGDGALRHTQWAYNQRRQIAARLFFSAGGDPMALRCHIRGASVPLS